MRAGRIDAPDGGSVDAVARGGLPHHSAPAATLLRSSRRILPRLGQAVEVVAGAEQLFATRRHSPSGSARAVECRRLRGRVVSTQRAPCSVPSTPGRAVGARWPRAGRRGFPDVARPARLLLRRSAAGARACPEAVPPRRSAATARSSRLHRLRCGRRKHALRALTQCGSQELALADPENLGRGESDLAVRLREPDRGEPHRALREASHDAYSVRYSARCGKGQDYAETTARCPAPPACNGSGTRSRGKPPSDRRLGR
jgi:hypothetical protein